MFKYSDYVDIAEDNDFIVLKNIIKNNIKYMSFIEKGVFPGLSFSMSHCIKFDNGPFVISG